MNTILRLAVATLMLAFATVAPAQSSGAIKKELKHREASLATDDADAIVELAVWAKDKGLFRDSKRLLEKAVKLNPDHAAANAAMGLVNFNGEWVTRAKAEVLREKAHDAAMKEKGFVKVDGVWIEKDKVKDAKRGVFWHEDKRVSREDKKAYSLGMVPHPRTGAFIPATETEKADNDMFLVEDGRWLSLKDADEYHANRDHPWVVRADDATVVSTLPLTKIEALIGEVNDGVKAARPLFLGKSPTPDLRPIIWIADGIEGYREIGSAIGGSDSAFGAFLAERELAIPGVGTVFPAVTYAHKDWGPYYVRHAAALSFGHGMMAPGEVQPPAWFMRGVGSLSERFLHANQTKHFANQHVTKGGIKNVKTWMSAFAISGELEPAAIEYNIFQAGLLLNFAMKGGNEDCLEAIQEVSEAIVNKPKNAKKAFKKLEKELIDAEDELREYLRKLSS